MDTVSLINVQNQVSLETAASHWAWFQFSRSSRDGLPYVLAVNGLACGGLVARDARSRNFLAFFKVADQDGRFPRNAECIEKGRLHLCMRATNAKLAKHGDLPIDFEDIESSTPATPGQLGIICKHGQRPPKNFSRLAASTAIDALFFGRSYQRKTGSRLRLDIGETALYRPSTWRAAA